MPENYKNRYNGDSVIMNIDNTGKNTYLSKSLFIRGLQCPKSLYLSKYHPELREEPDESQEALLQSGTDVGIYARQLFPSGVEIPYEEYNYLGQVEKTGAEIAKGTKTLYEATFSFDDIFIKADILNKGKVSWELYEVKSSTEVKDVYIDDIAIQYYVLTGSGLKISKASVVYINNEYTRNGDIDVNQLFTIEDITDRVIERVKTIPAGIETLRVALSGDMPVIDIGLQCSDPYECDFSTHCWQHIPENSVFDLRGRGIDKFEYYHNGIVRLEDVPLNDLNDRQRMQTEAFLEKKDYLNRDQVKGFLDSLWYPLCFFDFETIFPVIPRFDGTRPYQQVPFQYSLHLLQYEGAPLLHSEYLAQPRIDHRKELLQRLLDDIPGNACILAYNSSFEIMVLNNLSSQFQ
jgi:hypothetical protein